MKTKNILFLTLLIGLLLSCEENKEDEIHIYSIFGKVQKGPFITGTNVTLNELNENLGQTGKSFTTTITADDGSFVLNNIALNSGLALITANGFYFNELYGKLSGASLSLQAITKLSDKEFVNINVLTHLTKGRIEKLVANGLPFQDACSQAKNELLAFLGISETFDIDFESLDISGNEEYDAMLLAFSVILQRHTQFDRRTLTAELSQVLSNLSSDFSSDGQINSQSLIDTLMHNVSQLNLIDIRNNVEKRYADLGQSGTIPEFEKYIAKFQEKHSKKIYTSFTYPSNASPEPIIAPDAALPNVLVMSDTVFNSNGTPYSLAAIIPINSTLKIKFIADNSDYNYSIGGPISGWELVNEYPNGFTLNSQRQNQLMSMLFYFDAKGKATIEYYENDSAIPTYTKKIRWE